MALKSYAIVGATAAIGTAMLVAACDMDRNTRTSSAAYTTPSGQATARSFSTMRAGDLVGQNVYAANGDRIGEIDQVVVNRSSRATAAVIGVGGFLGIGERKAVVPISQLQWRGDRIVAPNLTKESLQTATYQERDWDIFDGNRMLSP